MPRRKKKKKLFYFGIKSSGKHSEKDVNDEKKELESAEKKRLAEQKKQDKIEEKQKKKEDKDRIKRIEKQNKVIRKIKEGETKEELKNNKYTNRKKDEEKFDFDKEVVLGVNNTKVKQSNRNNINIKKQKSQNKHKNNKIKMSFLVKCTSLLAFVIVTMICLFTSPVFKIAEIVVYGNNLVETNAIIELSGIKTGENMFKIDIKKIISNIKNNSYIRNVEINRELPNTIKINIVERETKYMLHCTENYMYLDNQGYLLELSQTALEIPIITGFEANEENLLKIKRLETKDLEKLNDVLKITETLNSYKLYDYINKFDVTNSKDYILHMEQLGKTVYIGDTSDLNNKILHLREILKQTEDRNGSIFINGNLNEGFKPYFRENI